MPLSSKTLAKIIDGLAIAVFVIDKDHKVTHWNTALEALSGRKRELMIGGEAHYQAFYKNKRPTMADMIVSGASAEEIERYYRGKYRKSALIEGAYEAEDFFPGLDTNGRWLHFTASPLTSDDGTMMGAIETLIDVTERKELENNLHHFLQLITRAQEEERKYIARELHDDMAQILGSSSRQLDNLLRTQHTFTPAQVSDLKEIQEQLNQGLKFVQRFIQNLRPSLLDDLGLVPALRSLTNNLEDTDGIITFFSVHGEEKRITSESELSLFRILQEALNNVRKHAQASEVQVVTEFNSEGIKLMVRDNGKGFKVPKNIDSLPGSGMLGLMGIQERVWLLDGSVEIKSEPGKGTTLLISIPTINSLNQEAN
jgi:two-component system sensor histidine kinase DegS